PAQGGGGGVGPGILAGDGGGARWRAGGRQQGRLGQHVHALPPGRPRRVTGAARRFAYWGPMRITVLGAGAMGGSVARLLARHEDVDVHVVDADDGRAAAVVGAIGRGTAAGLPTEGISAAALDGADAVAVCVPYRLNLEAM